MFRISLRLVVIAVIASFIVAPVRASAQSLTNVYGLAYSQFWTGWTISYSPSCTIRVAGDDGSVRSLSTWVSAWGMWLPSGHTYWIAAVANQYPYYRSQTVVVTVPQIPWWWPTPGVHIPDLVCRP